MLVCAYVIIMCYQNASIIDRPTARGHCVLGPSGGSWQVQQLQGESCSFRGREGAQRAHGVAVEGGSNTPLTHKMHQNFSTSRTHADICVWIYICSSASIVVQLPAVGRHLYNTHHTYTYTHARTQELSHAAVEGEEDGNEEVEIADDDQLNEVSSTNIFFSLFY